MANEYYTRPQQHTAPPLHEKATNAISSTVDFGQKIGNGFKDVVNVMPETAAVGIAIALFFYVKSIVANRQQSADGRSRTLGQRAIGLAIAGTVATVGYNYYLSTQGITVRGSEQSYKQIKGESALPTRPTYNTLPDSFDQSATGRSSAVGRQAHNTSPGKAPDTSPTPPGKPLECFMIPDPSKSTPKC